MPLPALKPAPWLALALALLASALLLAACGGDDSGANNETLSLTVYSGRSESLVGPLLNQFEADTGIDVRVRYGGTAELATTILEEGDRSPADLFFAQDARPPSAPSKTRAASSPSPTTSSPASPPRFRSPSGHWVGVSGRARVIVHSTDLPAADLPASVFDLTAPAWRGRVGWAPRQRLLPGLRHRHAPKSTATTSPPPGSAP